jgi:hypothetical protein
MLLGTIVGSRIIVAQLPEGNIAFALLAEASSASALRVRQRYLRPHSKGSALNPSSLRTSFSS